MKLNVCSYLHGDNDNLEQLQAQFEGLAAFGVELVTWAHEEVLELPAQGLLFLLRPQPTPRRRSGQPGVAMAVSVVNVLAAAVAGAVAVRRHRGNQAVLL